MLVKMKTTSAGPDFAAQAGDVVDVDNKFGKQLIADGNAEEYREVVAEYTTAFHGGLTAVLPTVTRRVDIPANPELSTAREQKEVAVDIERRTADELAADAKRDAVGAIVSTDPPAELTSDERAAQEIAVKVGEAQAATVDDKGSAHDKLTAKSDAPKSAKKS